MEWCVEQRLKVLEQDAEEDIWAWKGRSKRELEDIT